jgi:hypothetical protein
LVQLAINTLAAIDAQMASDQGASYRTFLGVVMPHMADAYRGADEGYRSHMGASLIGSECARKIWYGFRWTSKGAFSARILRLFNRGHLEEARFISMLLAIGCEVYQHDENGKQFRISDVGGHFGGSGDGVAMKVPDVPEGYACLLEFKTHNANSFKKLVTEGVRSAKFEHFVQMQVYLRKMGIHYALYMAVNKNDDDIYGEIITVDPLVGDQFVDRARTIIFMHEAPKRISNSAGYFECKWCDYHPICHMKKMPDTTCRTCNHIMPVGDGTWFCNQKNADRSKEDQLVGCSEWAPNITFGK